MRIARAESEAVEAMIVIATCSLRSSEILPFTIPQAKRGEKRTEWPWVHEPKGVLNSPLGVKEMMI